MDTRLLGVETDAASAAEEDVAPHRGLTPAERWDRFLDLLAFSETLRQSKPIEEWRRIWRELDALDDPGRWWERVPTE